VVGRTSAERGDSGRGDPTLPTRAGCEEGWDAASDAPRGDSGTRDGCEDGWDGASEGNTASSHCAPPEEGSYLRLIVVCITQLIDFCIAQRGVRSPAGRRGDARRVRGSRHKWTTLISGRRLERCVGGEDGVEPLRPACFRGGLVFEAHRLLYQSTLGLRVIKKKKRPACSRVARVTPEGNRGPVFRVNGCLTG